MIEKIFSFVNSQQTGVKVSIFILIFMLCIVIFFTLLGLVMSILGTTKKNIFKLVIASYNYAYSIIAVLLGFMFGVYFSVSCSLKMKSDLYYKRKRSAPTAFKIAESDDTQSPQSKKSKVPIWEKYPPSIRSFDGHYVRSKAEALIDDWLYHNKIFHITEKRIPGPDDLYCDFYLPEYDVYVEYWGLDSKEYLAKKEWKKNIYKNQDLKLFEIEDFQTKDIDHYLSVKIRELKIQALTGVNSRTLPG